jgi:hypothetical protein
VQTIINIERDVTRFVAMKTAVAMTAIALYIKLCTNPLKYLPFFLEYSDTFAASV